MIFSDTREVEPEAIENIIKSNSSKTGFNLKIQNNHLHCGDTPLQELQMQSILIAPILSRRADMVNGSRYMNGNGKNTPAYRRVGQTVLVKILRDMEFNRPLYYFTAPGIIAAGLGIGLGLGFLRDFYMGESLSFGPTLLMIVLILIGTFMAFTGIILHSISMIYDLARSG